jgi:hypothetical protein
MFLFDRQCSNYHPAFLTSQEVALRIPIDNWGNYESSLAEKPMITKTLINVVIYLLGDWLSQTVFQKKNVLDFDAMRTLRNGFIGLCFGPRKYTGEIRENHSSSCRHLLTIGLLPSLQLS